MTGKVLRQCVLMVVGLNHSIGATANGFGTWVVQEE